MSKNIFSMRKMMKSGLFTIGALLLSIAGVASATNGTGFYNLIYVNNGGFYLTQNSLSCATGAGTFSINGVSYTGNGMGTLTETAAVIGAYTPTSVATCYFSIADTPENLYSLLNTHWINFSVPTGYDTLQSLYLGTDLDLGEFSSETPAGECDANHKPLPATNGKNFIGNGFTIKNLCYVGGSKDHPVGFFSSIKNGQFNNLKFENVRIIMDTTSTNGADYSPVGTLAGVVDSSTVDTFSVANAVIDAPFAGSAVGYIKNATFKNVDINDDVTVQNSTVISANMVYSETEIELTYNNPYQVFLGGLAGVMTRTNTDRSMDNVSLKVEVKELTGSNNSVLGGAVGYLKASADTLTNVKVITKTSSTGDVLPSKISGGRTMGGVIGFATHADNGTIVLSKSFFEGEIGDAVSPDTIAVGGIVGRDASNADRPLKILNSEAKLTFKDSLKTAGKYLYYAGGILGFGEVCTGNATTSSDYVTITGSKSSGTMKLSSGSEVEGLYVDSVAVGGIAGKACFAYDGGLNSDTSSMNITVNVKSPVPSSAYNLGDVIVGGMVGAADLANFGDNSELRVSKMSFTGSISVADSLNATSIGGILGTFSGFSGGKIVAFDSIIVGTPSKMSNTVISYKATDATHLFTQEASIGGLCGYCVNVDEIKEAGVVGKITAEGSYAGDRLMVGGLLGYSNKTDKAVRFYIHNSYTVGDIDVSMAKSASTSVGFLVGSCTLYNGFTLLDDYHYSDNDNVENPIGYLSNGSNLTEGWKDNTSFTSSESIHYVLRNGDATDVSSMSNGTKTSSEMKDSTFASFMNKGIKTYASTEDYVWTYVEGSNNELPFISTSSTHIIAPDGATYYTVTFKAYNPDSSKIAVVATSVVEEGNAAKEPTLSNWEGRTFANWDSDFSSVTSDMTVTAKYTLNQYEVAFIAYEDGDAAADTIAKMNVNYGESATVPDYTDASVAAKINREGKTFAGWNSEDYKKVTKDLCIKAVYSVNSYAITFVNPDGAKAGESLTVKYGDPIPALPTTATLAENDSMTYTFKEWDKRNAKDFTTMPAWDLEFLAVYDSTVKQYTVTFKDYDGTVLSTAATNYGVKPVPPAEYTPKSSDIRLVSWKDTSAVVHGATSVTAVVNFKVTFKYYTGKESSMWLANGTSMVPYGNMMTVSRPDSAGYSFEFVGWDKEFATLEGPTVYVAQFTKTLIPESSSSSWSEAIESSSSSESEERVESSSSDATETSSGSVVVATGVKISADSLEQSGSAIRIAYTVDIENPSIKTKVFAVIDDSTYAMVDSVETESLEDAWVLAPAPLGEHSVKLVVTNGVKSDTAEVGEFSVATEIAAAPKVWQMVSMADADGDLKALSSKTSIYWWDETNPIGEYWQYHSYAGEDFEAARGFWYGSSAGIPIALHEGTAMTEFVWDLDSLYSGWNLVSNPTGWNVDLSEVLKNKNVLQIRSWNADSAYGFATTLKPYEAVWVQVSGPTSVTVDATPVFETKTKALSVAQKIASLRKSLNKTSNSWSVLAVLKDEKGKTDSWNVIGAGSADETLDKAPSGMGDYVSLSIMNGSHRLAKSVKAEASEYEWELKLSATSARDAELSFEGVEALASLGLSLTVTVDGESQVVTNSSPVKVALTKDATVATVRVAPAATLASTKISGFAVTQVANGLEVGFSVPENLAGANASYALVSVNGKKIASGSFKATAGTNSVNLSVREAGLYFVQLKVGSQKSSAKVMMK